MRTPGRHLPSKSLPCRNEVTNKTLNTARTLGLLVLVALIAGCARHYAAETNSDPYGFFSGIWHGIVFPYALLTNLLSWLLSLVDVNFVSSIEIIGRPNTGIFFYYIGFALGLSAYGGSGAAAR